MDIIFLLGYPLDSGRYNILCFRVSDDHHIFYIYCGYKSQADTAVFLLLLTIALTSVGNHLCKNQIRFNPRLVEGVVMPPLVLTCLL